MVTGAAPRIRVLVVEDESLFRDLLVRSLAGESIEVVGEAADGETAIRLARRIAPDVVLMDIGLAGEMDGITAGVRIKSERPEANIVILSALTEKQHLSIIPFGETEGWSYLLKQSVSDTGALVSAIEGSASGLTVLDSGVIAGLKPRQGSILTSLTARQMDVLELIAQGYNNATIAEKLSVEITSIENYINATYRALQLSDERGVQPRVKATLIYVNGMRGG